MGATAIICAPVASNSCSIEKRLRAASWRSAVAERFRVSPAKSALGPKAKNASPGSGFVSSRMEALGA